jgi:hypothetical protein
MEPKPDSWQVTVKLLKTVNIVLVFGLPGLCSLQLLRFHDLDELQGNKHAEFEWHLYLLHQVRRDGNKEVGSVHPDPDCQESSKISPHFVFHRASSANSQDHHAL